jgi:hypothetical protein
VAVLRISYRDLPVAVRKRAASAAKARHRAIAGDPTASEENRKYASAQLVHLTKWENGTLPEPEGT